MKIEELRLLAKAGVKVEISAAELLQVLQAMVQRPATPENWLSLAAASAKYQKNPKTLARYIHTGVLRGMKVGGVWLVEDPESRAKRLNIN